MSKKLSEKRERLKKLEKSLQDRFEEQTNKVQTFAKSRNTKIIALAAAGAIVGFIAYRALSNTDDKEGSQQKSKSKPTKNKFTADLISKALKSFLPYVIDILGSDKETQDDPR